MAGFIFCHQVDMMEASHTEVFPSQEVVYLTPDSGQVLTSLSKGHVYVIGGLVDESVNKVSFHMIFIVIFYYHYSFYISITTKYIKWCNFFSILDRATCMGMSIY